LQVYKNLLAHTRKVSTSVDCMRYLFYDAAVNKSDEWSNDNYIKSVQSDGHLGNRMSTAFKTVLTMQSKAVIVGSDCPEINKEVINEAFLQLEDHDTVIGPTYDGGYYLLGMKSWHRELFEDVPWSTPAVYRKTIQIIESKGLTVHNLRKMHDLDYKEDLDRFPFFMA